VVLTMVMIVTSNRYSMFSPKKESLGENLGAKVADSRNVRVA